MVDNVINFGGARFPARTGPHLAGLGLLPRGPDEELKYASLLGPDDRPDINWNHDKMERHRPEMRKYYYDPACFGSYLEQLQIR